MHWFFKIVKFVIGQEKKIWHSNNCSPIVQVFWPI